MSTIVYRCTDNVIRCWVSPSPRHLTDGPSDRPSWRRAPFGTHDQMLMCCETITGLVVMGHPPSRAAM